MYKYKTNALPEIFADHFQDLANSDYPKTRNRGKLFLPRIWTEQGKKMMKYQGACVWNTISGEFVFETQFPTLSHFNKILKRSMISKYVS